MKDDLQEKKRDCILKLVQIRCSQPFCDLASHDEDRNAQYFFKFHKPSADTSAFIILSSILCHTFRVLEPQRRLLFGWEPLRSSIKSEVIAVKRKKSFLGLYVTRLKGVCNIPVFWLLLNGCGPASRLSFQHSHSEQQAVVGKILKVTQPGQLTQTDERDIPYCMKSAHQ